MERNAGASKQRSNLKKFLDNNPLVVLVGVVVTACTTIAGVMEWRARDQITILEEQHKVDLMNETAKFHEELATTTVKAKDELVQATEPLKTTIEDLSRKMASIERRMPDSGPKYLDVSTLTVGPETVKTLGSKFQLYDDDSFYEYAPEAPGWAYSDSDEFKFNSTMYGLDQVEPTSELERVLADAKTHVWKFNRGVHFKIKSSSDSDVDLTYFPEIIVERLDREAIQKRTKAVAGLLTPIFDSISEKESKTADLRALMKGLDDRLQVKAVNNTADGPEASKDVESTVDDADISASIRGVAKKLTDPIIDSSKLKIELVNKMDLAIDYDMSNFFLADQLLQAVMMPMLYTVKPKIISAQKKGNVFYVQEEITYPKARVYKEGVETNEEETVVIDKEVFFFGRGSDCDIVQIYLPRQVNPDGFVYTQSWLLGFRVLVE